MLRAGPIFPLHTRQSRFIIRLVNTKEDQITPAKPRKTWKQVSLRLLKSLTFIYLGVTLGCSVIQEKLIFPGSSSQGQSWATIAPADDRELVKLRSSIGDDVYVLFGKALQTDGSPRSDSATRPTIVLFYGNGMTLSDMIGLSRDWRKLGTNVISLEYPGYGMSTGKPGEASIYSAAKATWEYLEKRGDVNMTRIIPTGISIGCAVAMETAHKHPSAAGLILLAPFTTLPDMARKVLPIFPASLLLRHKFDNQSKIADLKLPIFIAHGNHDRVIPTSMSEELVRAATKATSIRRIIIDSDHNDLLELGETEINEGIAQMIDLVAQAPAK